MARRVGAGTVGAAVIVALAAGCAPYNASPPVASAPPVSVPSPGGPAAETPVVPAGAPPERTAVLRIMPLGDSITRGAGSRDGDGYRARLHRDLTASGLRVNFVGSQRGGPGPDPDHEGHSGWTMAQLSAGIDRWLRRARPDVVLLHVGTNDLRTERAAERAPQRLARLLFQIARARPRAEVFVAQIVGNRSLEDGKARQRRADRYNAVVPGVVAAAGPRFHLVDLSLVRGRDLADKLHPNNRGYATIAATFYSAIVLELSSPPVS